MKAASPSSWISAVPRLPFQPLASSRRKVSSAAATSSRVRATSKRDSAMLGQPVALAAQLLQLLGPQRVAQQFVGVARGVEAGAELGLQHARTQAVLPQHLAEGFHGCAIERHVAQDQRMRAGVPRRPQQSRRGVMRPVAVERRRAQRAVGMGADQSGQRESCRRASSKRPASGRSAGSRHQARHRFALIARTRRCGRCAEGVHRHFPGRKIIAVRFDRAFGKRAPLAQRDGRQRRAGLRGIASSDARPTAALSAISTTSPFPRSRGGGASVAPRASRVAGEC